MAGAGGAPMFSLCIAYLDENVKPKYTSLFIALYYVSGFLGPSVGFVIAGQLLSLYVDIEQVREKKAFKPWSENVEHIENSLKSPKYFRIL